MAPRVYYRDSSGTTIEITDYIDRTNPWTLVEKAEEGAIGVGTLVVNDPDLDLDFDGLRRLWVEEDDSESTDDVIFGGFVDTQKIGRGEGDNAEPLGRVWTLSILDANSIWHRRVLTGADCKRPNETDVERVEWMLGAAESGIFDDVTTYVSSANDQAMDKADLRRQYRDQIMGDCAEHAQKNWWAQYQETGSGREWVVWYGKDSLTAYTSDLFLSNDPNDWVDSELLDGTSLVWPYSQNAEMNRSADRVYSGVLVQYEKGWVYRHDSDTTTAYARRDYIAPARNIKTKAKAIARAERLLERLDTQDKRISLTVRLPKGKATMIRAGMRVRVKGTHWPGLSDGFYWCRVLTCAATPHPSGDFYDLALELTPNGNGQFTQAPAVRYAFAAVFIGSLAAFDIQASDDGSSWSTVIDGATLDAGTTNPPNATPDTYPGLVAIPEEHWRHRYWRLTYSAPHAGGFFANIVITSFRLLSEGSYSAVCRLGTTSGAEWFEPFVSGCGTSGQSPCYTGVSYDAVLTGAPELFGGLTTGVCDVGSRGTSFSAPQGCRYGIRSGVFGATTVTATWTFDIGVE